MTRKEGYDREEYSKTMKSDNKLKTFLKIIKEVENDPEVKKKMEDAQRQYGTLTGEDLMKRFTI